VLGPVKSRPSESRKPRSRSPKSPRWSAERRAPVRNGRGASAGKFAQDCAGLPARRRLMVAPLGAPSPRACPQGPGLKALPAPCKKQGGRSVGLIGPRFWQEARLRGRKAVDISRTSCSRNRPKRGRQRSSNVALSPQVAAVRRIRPESPKKAAVAAVFFFHRGTLRC